MLVPKLKSHETRGSSDGRRVRATSPKTTRPRKSRGYAVEISEWRAMATFLAARKLSRMGIDSDRSRSRTVLERVSVSVRSTSKSSGSNATGVPPPRRVTALRSVRWMSRLNGSPHS